MWPSPFDYLLDFADSVEEETQQHRDRESYLLHLEEEINELRSPTSKENEAEEVADIAIILAMFCTTYNIDLDQAINAKMDKLKRVGFSNYSPYDSKGIRRRLKKESE